MSFVDKYWLNELRSLPNNFTKNDGLLEQEYLELFKFLLCSADFSGTEELAIQQQLTQRSYFALNI